jgi:hypothetical protein
MPISASSFHPSPLLIQSLNSHRNQDSPPAEYGSRHQDTEPSTPRIRRPGKKIQMWRLFRPREYRGQNKRHGFLEEYQEGPFDRLRAGRRGFVCCSISSVSRNVSRKGCGNFGPATAGAKFPQHWFSFLQSSLCLRVSSRTRRVVNLFRRAEVVPVQWLE